MGNSQSGVYSRKPEELPEKLNLSAGKMLIREFKTPSPDLNGSTILITGGTGSFGTAFLETVLARYDPKRIIIFSRDELKQSELARRYPMDKYSPVRYFIGDVRDRNRLDMAMRDVTFVIHAAALKQVPTAEYNPIECINTNVIGAENVVQAAIQNGVTKVIALSSDKAANPINLYGASKLASDKIFVAANNLSGMVGTRFAVVRYGNVIGSRGSVVPLFKKLIAEKAKELPITDPEMTRFWITLGQGVNFVLSSLELLQGGEIFVPKLPSMTMKDFVTAFAPDMEQRIIGIRPGEKMHETMISKDDARVTVELDDRYVILPSFNFWSAEEMTPAGSQPVSKDFVYASDTNTEHLDAETLRQMLAQ